MFDSYGESSASIATREVSTASAMGQMAVALDQTRTELDQALTHKTWQSRRLARDRREQIEFLKELAGLLAQDRFDAIARRLADKLIELE